MVQGCDDLLVLHAYYGILAGIGEVKQLDSRLGEEQCGHHQVVPGVHEIYLLSQYFWVPTQDLLSSSRKISKETEYIKRLLTAGWSQ